MKYRISITKVLTLGLILLVAFPCFATSETDETVSRYGTVNDDFYAAGGTVNIDANIIGDLVISGGELFIGNRVQGDVIAAGGSINLGGEILDDVRIAGGEVMIDATIGDDLMVAGGEIKVSSTTSIGGDTWLAGGDVYMAGKVNNNLFIRAGNIRISGTVHGDVELEGGEIEILEGALIEGNLHYKSPDKAKIHPDAKITGNLTYEQMQWDHPHRGYGIFFSLTLVVAGIVLFLIFPGFTMSAVGRVSDDPWRSLGVGFVLLVVTPVVAVLLTSIVLGVWVGLSMLALYFVALLTGLLIGCFFVGDWGARRLHKNVVTTAHRIVSVTIAIILLGFIQLIPFFGGLLLFALLLLGLGAGILQLHNVYSQSGGVKDVM